MFEVVEIDMEGTASARVVNTFRDRESAQTWITNTRKRRDKNCRITHGIREKREITVVGREENSK